MLILDCSVEPAERTGFVSEGATYTAVRCMSILVVSDDKESLQGCLISSPGTHDLLSC